MQKEAETAALQQHATSRIHDPSNRVAYQGTAGAFGEDAARMWCSSAEPHAVRTFSGVLDALTSGSTEWAVIPVWNSTIGPVTSACAALDRQAAAVVLVGHVDVPVRHCLLALPGTTIEDVRFVGSHPAAFAQCTRLLDERSLVACEAYNTAGAARELAAFGTLAPRDDGEPWYSRLTVETPARLAAIASAAAARHYGLTVIRRDVQDHASNVTRFVVLRARSTGVSRSRGDHLTVPAEPSRREHSNR